MPKNSKLDRMRSLTFRSCWSGPQAMKPFSKALADDLADLVTKAPKSLIDSVPELDAVRLGNVTDLVKAVSPGLLARLLN